MYESTSTPSEAYFERPPLGPNQRHHHASHWQRTGPDQDWTDSNRAAASESSLAPSGGRPPPSLSIGDKESLKILSTPEGQPPRKTILELLDFNRGFYYFFKTYGMRPGLAIMDTNTKHTMFKAGLKYPKDSLEYIEALGLLELYISFLDPTILSSVRDILNGADWHSSQTAGKVIEELALTRDFREKYTRLANSSVARMLIGEADCWQFNSELQDIKKHKLIYMLYTDVIAFMDVMHWSLIDGIRLVTPTLICDPNTKIAGYCVPNHTLTAPPVVSFVAQKILAAIGIKRDSSKSESQLHVLDMHSDLIQLFTAPIVLQISERILQEIGLETVARAMERDRQHVETFPFAILAMASCLVVLELEVLADLEKNNGRRIVDAPTFNRLTDAEKSVMKLLAGVLRGYETRKETSPVQYGKLAPVITKFHKEHKFAEVLERMYRLPL